MFHCPTEKGGEPLCTLQCLRFLLLTEYSMCAHPLCLGGFDPIDRHADRIPRKPSHNYMWHEHEV